MATMMMSELEQRLRVEVREELERSIRQKLEAEYQTELARMQESERTRFEDRLGHYRKDCERDFDGRVDAEAERLWQARRDAYVERLETLREDLDAAIARCTILEHGLLALLTAVFPQIDVYRAIARYCSIDSLDMTAIAPALAAINRRLAFRTSDSQHSIMLKVDGGNKIVHLCALKTNQPLSVDPRTEETDVDGPIG